MLSWAEDSLGFGDEENVTEEEEVAFLRLQSSLQLGVTMGEECPHRTQKRQDQRTRLRTDGRQAVVPKTHTVTHPHKTHVNSASGVEKHHKTASLMPSGEKKHPKNWVTLRQRLHGNGRAGEN